MPMKESEVPIAVYYRSLEPAHQWQPEWPERVDAIIFLEQVAADIWEGQGDLLWSQLYIDEGRWAVSATVGYGGPLAFYGLTENLDDWETDNELPIFSGAYYLGNAMLLFEPVPNLVAELTGAITGPKSFYEPMPKASPHRSFRYARHSDGTRIYVRMDG